MLAIERMRRGFTLFAAAAMLSACGDYSGGAGQTAGGTGVSTGSPTGEATGALSTGAQNYARLCASCHGPSGKGGVGPALTSTATCPSCETRADLIERIADTMPSTSPGTCTGDCASSIADYILGGFSSGTGSTTGTSTGGTGATGGSSAGGSTGTAAGGAGGGTTGSPTPTCSVEFKYASNWSTGFVAEVTLRNFSGAQVSGWEVRWTFPNDQRITNSWNTDLAQVGQAMNAKPKDYNRSIADGASISFGMQGTHGGTSDLPSDVSLIAPGCVTASSSGGGTGSTGGTTGGGTTTGGSTGGTTGGTTGGGTAACPVEELSPRLLRLLTRREYDRSLRSLLGIPGDFSQFLPVEPRIQGYDNNARALVVTDRHLDEYLAAAEAAAERAIGENKAGIVGCAPGASCTEQFVNRFGRRAFRRPLTSDESTRFRNLMRDELTGGDYDTGLKLIITAFLTSPDFLYRSEVGSAAANGYALSAYEIASSMAYTIWGSTPDDALLDAAASGALLNSSERRTQTARMLDDARAREQWAWFAEQWLGVTGMREAFKDPEVFPRFNDTVRESMFGEFQRFLGHVAFDSTAAAPFAELFTADYVFADGPLAEFYRIAGAVPSDPEFRSYPVSNGQRGGLLSTGVVLGALAHSNESSPVKRGVALRERILCQDLPDPPADVDTTPPGLDRSLTTRERFARHTDDPRCSSCHSYIDQVGFGFEGYDGVGDYREMEHGRPVDQSGSVKDRERFGAGTNDTFSGVRELGALMAQTRAAQDCVALQYFRHGFGHLESEGGSCTVSAMQKAFQDGQLSFRALMTETLAHESFTRRR